MSDRSPNEHANAPADATDQASLPADAVSEPRDSPAPPRTTPADALPSLEELDRELGNLESLAREVSHQVGDALDPVERPTPAALDQDSPSQDPSSANNVTPAAENTDGEEDNKTESITETETPADSTVAVDAEDSQEPDATPDAVASAPGEKETAAENIRPAKNAVSNGDDAAFPIPEFMREFTEPEQPEGNAAADLLSADLTNGTEENPNDASITDNAPSEDVPPRNQPVGHSAPSASASVADREESPTDADVSDETANTVSDSMKDLTEPAVADPSARKPAEPDESTGDQELPAPAANPGVEAPPEGSETTEDPTPPVPDFMKELTQAEQSTASSDAPSAESPEPVTAQASDLIEPPAKPVAGHAPDPSSTPTVAEKVDQAAESNDSTAPKTPSESADAGQATPAKPSRWLPLLTGLSARGLGLADKTVGVLEALDRPFAFLSPRIRVIAGWFALATFGTSLIVLLISLF